MYSLSNLFNAIPHTSPLRYSVYSAILELATSNDRLDTLQLQRPTVEKWLTEWQISQDEKALFLKSLVDAFAAAGQSYVVLFTQQVKYHNLISPHRTTAYEYSLSYVRTLPSTSPKAQSAAIDLITTALRLPTLFDFDRLFKLDSVVALKGHEIFSLLQVFLGGGLPELDQWQASHVGVAEKYSTPFHYTLMTFIYLRPCFVMYKILATPNCSTRCAYLHSQH